MLSYGKEAADSDTRDTHRAWNALPSQPYSTTSNPIGGYRQEVLKMRHWSDCAVHNEPALPAGACDCGGVPIFRSLRLRTVLGFARLMNVPVDVGDSWYGERDYSKYNQPMESVEISESDFIKNLTHKRLKHR